MSKKSTIAIVALLTIVAVVLIGILYVLLHPAKMEQVKEDQQVEMKEKESKRKADARMEEINAEEAERKELIKKLEPQYGEQLVNTMASYPLLTEYLEKNSREGFDGCEKVMSFITERYDSAASSTLDNGLLQKAGYELFYTATSGERERLLVLIYIFEDKNDRQIKCSVEVFGPDGKELK